tara:strand:+ start:285 stop:881 length:597 start_codon:yes stop_codon:yes gene_type:complete
VITGAGPVVSAANVWDTYTSAATVVGGFATGLAVGIAVATLLAGLLQMNRAVRLSHEMNALDSYQAYLNLCIEYPEFTSTTLAKEKLKIDDMSKVDDLITPEAERYVWFISFLLSSCEKILRSANSSRKWSLIIENQLSYHRSTLVAVWPRWSFFFSSQLDELVRKVIAEDYRPGLEFPSVAQGSKPSNSTPSEANNA